MPLIIPQIIMIRKKKEKSNIYSVRNEKQDIYLLGITSKVGRNNNHMVFFFRHDSDLTSFQLQVSTVKRPPKPLPRTRAPAPPPPPKEKPPVAEKPGATGNPPVPERPPKPAAPVAPLVGQRHNVVLMVLTVNLPLIPFYCFRLKLKGPNPKPPPDQPSDHWPSPLYDSTPRLRYAR